MDCKPLNEGVDDMMEWSSKPNLNPLKDLGLALGSKIEVLYDVSEGLTSTSDEMEVDRVWWGGELVAEASTTNASGKNDGNRGSQAFALSSKWRLKYQKYGSFEEEERTVVFLEPHLLVDIDDQQILEWRKEGEMYEPAVEDQVVTLGEVEKEVEGGTMEEGMMEFTKMPFAQQQKFASNYRLMADSFKERFRELIEKHGEGYIVGAEDIHKMVEGIKSNSSIKS